MSNTWSEGNAKTYDEKAQKSNETIHNLLDELDYLKKPELKILDFGCGTGNHSMYLANRGHSVVGVDTSKSMIEKARSKSSLKFQVLEKEDGSECKQLGQFNFILSSLVLHHADHPIDILNNLKECLVDGGMLCVIEFADTPQSRLAMKDLHPEGDDHSHSHGEHSHGHSESHAHQHQHGKHDHSHGHGINWIKKSDIEGMKYSSLTVREFTIDSFAGRPAPMDCVMYAIIK